MAIPQVCKVLYWQLTEKLGGKHISNLLECSVGTKKLVGANFANYLHLLFFCDFAKFCVQHMMRVRGIKMFQSEG